MKLQELKNLIHEVIKEERSEKIKSEGLTNPNRVDPNELQNKISKARDLIQNALKVSDLAGKTKFIMQALDILTERREMLREFSWKQGTDFRKGPFMKPLELNPKYKGYTDYWDKYIQPKLSKDERDTDVVKNFDTIVNWSKIEGILKTNPKDVNANLISALRKLLVKYDSKGKLDYAEKQKALTAPRTNIAAPVVN